MMQSEPTERAGTERSPVEASKPGGPALDGAAVAAEGLAKSFDRGTRALDGLDLRIEPGTAYGLIGRNGAGKTTTLRILMGLLRADGGRARVLGHSMLTAPAPVRERVAYVSQGQNLHPWMTLEELCRFASHLYSRWEPSYAARLAATFGLPKRRAIGVLSGGEKRKAAILLALAARPDVLMLDEPAAGLDPVARRELIDELVEILADRPDCTLLFSSHIISDLERIVDHVGVVDRGRMVLEGAVDELKATTRRLQIIFDGSHVPPGFKLPGAVRLEVDGPVVSAVVRVQREEELDGLADRFDGRVTLFPLGLEEIFIETVGREPGPYAHDEEVA